MLLVPRSYQIECNDALWDYFSRSSGNPICALPTGTGKSVVIALFLMRVFQLFPRQKVVVATHVKELIKQNYDKLLTWWPGAPAGINSAGLGVRNIYDPIIFAGIGSVAKHASSFDHVDLLIIDEAHLVSPTEETMYQKFINGLRARNPLLKVIGFTATPWRLGQGHITSDGIFTDVAFDITGMDAFNRLIAEGYLVAPIPKKPKTLLATDGVHMRGGEFIQGELQTAVDRNDITEAAVRECVEFGAERKHWLTFCAGVEHAVHTAEMFNYYGISSIAIHSKMGDKERDKAIKAWMAGEYRNAVNNNVLTTGIDFPGIDFIPMLRPTASPVLWVQMIGRGTRPCPEEGKQNCLVMDFAGNTRRLGPINDPVIPRKKGSKPGDAPVRLCEMCGTWNHASVRHCVECGYEFPPPASKLHTQAGTEVIVKGELPIVEVFRVDQINVSQHDKHGSPPSMKVAYICGTQLFMDFVCVEHQEWAGRKARQWWADRTDEPMPRTTLEALLLVDKIKTPTHLRVWVNKGKFAQIMAYCYDGTAFGTVQPSDSDEAPVVHTEIKQPKYSPASREVHAANRPSNIQGPSLSEYEDDIPF